ncbi:hypothetical protein F0562_015003 [Nyssa sinensis]|uniref:NAD-dependent epimerase/dehydratase domain-containing protein n=1 Tax=Nyssa sinensis TaxID=561372 RepID=A0A5J4ZPW9_9ASTE|nr:hypothetical protein F0562_015003 [Nyssa sinensis]
MEKNIKVCVTGGASFLGSSLVKKLLERGYYVNATLRNLGDPLKVGLLKGLPNADTRLELFEADIYNPDEFGRTIQGCQTVVHMATPLQHNPLNSQYKDTCEAAVAGVKSIVGSCIRSGTVKRLIYTASVVAASPLKDDGTGYKGSMDESCWTPLNLPYAYSNDGLMGYTHSKTLSEKEVLGYNDSLEVVSLACGLVGGDTLLSSMSESIGVLISQITGDKRRYGTLRFLEELIGKVPIVHIQDVTMAHIFCMENSSISGRFLCASTYLSSAQIASYYQKYYPDIDIVDEFNEDTKRAICWGSTKLKEMGFEYKYDIKMILDDCLQCAKRMDG